MKCALSLLLRYGKEPFLNGVVTCDEKWILYDNRQRSAEWLDRDEAPKHMPKREVFIQKRWSSPFGGWRPESSITAFYHRVNRLRQRSIVLDEFHRKLCEKYPALENWKMNLYCFLTKLDCMFHKWYVWKLKELTHEILPQTSYSLNLLPSITFSITWTTSSRIKLSPIKHHSKMPWKSLFTRKTRKLSKVA